MKVTVKSVNHRFLDVAIKAPSTLAPLEARVRALVQQRLTRGRVEIALAVEEHDAGRVEVVLDERLLERVAAALATARGAGSSPAADGVRRAAHSAGARDPVPRTCAWPWAAARAWLAWSRAPSPRPSTRSS